MKLLPGAAIGAAALVAALGAHAGSGASGFRPESFSAFGRQDIWLLGTVPCRSGRCPAVIRTADGGRTFVRVHAPPLRMGEGGGFVDGQVLLADRSNGYAYGWRAPLSVTHDGGETWHRLARRQVLAFAAASGVAYAVTGLCGRDGSCSSIRFEHSPISRDDWRPIPMPFSHAVPGFDLAARGSDVWLFGGQRAGRHGLRNVLARSTDGGRTFFTGPAPCYADLAAELEPISSRVVWAFCPTGMMGVAWRSTNGGTSFRPLSVPRCCSNGASLAPATQRVAVLARNAAGAGIVRTTDGGMTWRASRAPVDATYRIVFVDSRVGLAIAVFPTATQLWKTTDAGASWHRVPIP